MVSDLAGHGIRIMRDVIVMLVSTPRAGGLPSPLFPELDTLGSAIYSHRQAYDYSLVRADPEHPQQESRGRAGSRIPISPAR